MTVRGVEIEVRRDAAVSSAADHVLGERDARERAGAAPDEENCLPVRMAQHRAAVPEIAFGDPGCEVRTGELVVLQSRSPFI